MVAAAREADTRLMPDPADLTPETSSLSEHRAVLPWYALRVKSNFEKAAKASLEGKGYEVYAPFYSRRRRWSDRDHLTESPLFPGYVFARFDARERLPLLITPGVVHVVPPNRVPIEVDDEELRAVQVILRSGLPVEPHRFLNVGQRVMIERGALSGIEGILLEVKKAYRLVVSVTLLNRSVSVEIDRDWVRAVGNGRK